jgi:hypothetical protein
MKKNEKKIVLQFEKKKYFSNCSFLAAPLALLFKDVKPEKAFL